MAEPKEDFGYGPAGQYTIGGKEQCQVLACGGSIAQILEIVGIQC